MAAYNLAVRAMYNQAVVSLAVLCDERRNWRPESFSYGHGNYHTEVKFGIAKLLDYCQDVDALEADDNPFAAIALAHWQTMQTRRDPETRTQWKLRIVKGLYRRQWTKEDVQQLFVLIDWVMALPIGFEDAFDQKMVEFEEERKMVWISSMERYGMKRGREKGRYEGLLEAIALNLDTKFGAAGRRLLRKARALPDVTALRRFTRFLAKTDDLEKVRAYFD